VLVEGLAVKIVGAAMVLAGLLIYAAAVRRLADSWRLGIDRTAPGALVTSGTYSWSRNPIYLALDLQVVGAFFVLGTLIALLAALAAVALLHDQVRREERFLAGRYGDAYRRYRRRVGRYVSRL
jgi:protein-S-isoprenylcysteine O-methyltransferase Ste14